MGNSITEISGFCLTLLKLAKKRKGKWKTMPKGWDKDSRHSYYKNMGKSVSKCMKKMKEHVDDPGAFCASLKDRESGSTKWRGAAAAHPMIKQAALEQFGWENRRDSNIADYIKVYLENMLLLNASATASPGMRPDFKIAAYKHDDHYNVVVYGIFNNVQFGQWITEAKTYEKQLTQIVRSELNKKFANTEVNVIVACMAGREPSKFGV